MQTPKHLTRHDVVRLRNFVEDIAKDASLDGLSDEKIEELVLAVDVMVETHLEADVAKIVALSRERDSFLNDRNKFAAEQDKIRQLNESLVRQRDLANKERDDAVAARNKVWREKSEFEFYTAAQVAKVSAVLGRKTMVGDYAEPLVDAAVRMSNEHFALTNAAKDGSKEALKVANDRIAQLESGFGEVCKHLGMGVPEDASDKADAIINLLKLNYIHMDTLAGGERLFDCRICNKRSRWNHEHQTLGYVQRLCSDCFQEHGAAPTDKSLGDGSYAKAVRMGSPLRSPNAQNELDAVKSALGECWMEGDGRTVAGTVKSVCEALDRSNEQRSELEKALADFIFGTQDALGDFWGKGRIGSSSAEIIRGVCAKAREAELMFEERRQLAEYRAAFDRILVALGIKTDYPTIAGKAQACVSIIESFIKGYGLMDETNKARRELFEKAAKVFEKLAEEWKIAGSVQLANTLGSAERS